MIPFLDSLIWHPPRTYSGTCWVSLPEMRFYRVLAPLMEEQTSGCGTFDDLRSPLRQQAFRRQTWLTVHGISINGSQTSVWGLGRSGKDSRVKLNSTGYRLFPLWSDTCQSCETVETGKQCFVSSLMESSCCPSPRHLLPCTLVPHHFNKVTAPQFFQLLHHVSYLLLRNNPS